MTKLSEAVDRLKADIGPTAATIDGCVNVDAGDISTILRALEERTAALRVFMGEDERFTVSIGGNPIAIERFLASARAALKEEKP
jgi:hypothetical protein